MLRPNYLNLLKQWFLNFLDLLESTWYLISEPFIQLWIFYINKIASHWILYLYLKYKLTKRTEMRNSDKEILINHVNKALKKQRLFKNQANKLIEIINKIPDSEKIIYPNMSKCFKK